MFIFMHSLFININKFYIEYKINYTNILDTAFFAVNKNIKNIVKNLSNGITV